MTHATGAVCVIVNPAAGKGRGARRLEAVRRSLGANAEFRMSEGPGHATELAREAAVQGFALVAAAGGDGTVHEVANGILRAERPNVCFGVLPLGSANDLARSLHSRPDLQAIDVGLATLSDGRQRYFVCNVGLGFNGYVTLESRRIRRLQGLALYGLATLQALWRRFACPAMTIAFDDLPSRTADTLMLSVLLGQREGGFPLAPDAVLDDGWFDYVRVGAMSRWQVLQVLPRLALWGPPKHPLIDAGRCRSFTLVSAAPLPIHVDGEMLCLPEDDVRRLDVRLLPSGLRVDAKFGR